MKRLILSTSVLMSVVAFAQTPMIAPPERRTYVTSIGDVLEWQPGLGIVVLSGREITQRRTVRSDGKTVIQAERSVQIKATTPRKRPLDLRKPRANQPLRDEGENLMEEIDKIE